MTLALVGTGTILYVGSSNLWLIAGGSVVWGFVLALVAIVASFIFGFHMGTWFSLAMIGFAGAAVLYDTSNIMHHYPEDRYVAASMALFASIAMMFWYILRLFMSRE